MEEGAEDKRGVSEEEEGDKEDRWLMAFAKRFSNRYWEDLAEIAASEDDQEE